MNRTDIKLYLLILFATLICFSSCIDEDVDNCGSSINIKFDYSYNMLSANAFREQVDMVTLYIFDARGILVAQKTITDKFTPDYTASLDGISQGKYTLVAWAKSNQINDEKSDFIIPKLTTGSSKMSDLSYYISQSENIAKTELNNFLVGTSEFTARGELSIEEVTVHFKKVTNKIRVILLDSTGKSLDVANFDMSIVDAVGNGHINYNYDVLPGNAITYYPYFAENRLVDPSIGIFPPTGNEVYAAISEFSISRLMESNAPILHLKNKGEDNSFMKIDIAEYLLMGMIEANAKEYSVQEYFDRQDQYTIVLYLNQKQNVWVWVTIVINGWVINNVEIEM